MFRLRLLAGRLDPRHILLGHDPLLQFVFRQRVAC